MKKLIMKLAMASCLASTVSAKTLEAKISPDLREDWSEEQKKDYEKYEKKLEALSKFYFEVVKPWKEEFLKSASIVTESSVRKIYLMSHKAFQMMLIDMIEEMFELRKKHGFFKSNGEGDVADEDLNRLAVEILTGGDNFIELLFLQDKLNKQKNIEERIATLGPSLAKQVMREDDKPESNDR